MDQMHNTFKGSVEIKENEINPNNLSHICDRSQEQSSELEGLAERFEKILINLTGRHLPKMPGDTGGQPVPQMPPIVERLVFQYQHRNESISSLKEIAEVLESYID